MLERILVPLDGSELANRILTPVSRLAARTRSEVRAIRVLDGFAADQSMLRGENPHAIAAAELGRALEPLERAGIRTTYDTYMGDAATRILDDAATYRPSLIAMATHGRVGADRWVRGSVAERVLRRSAFPVYLANPRAIGKELAIERILVPLDGSEMSAAVLPAVGDFARVHDASVVLLHVIDPEPTIFGEPPTREQALERLEPFARRLEGLRVRTMAEKGSPPSVILETAREAAIDLLAMTTHGRSGISRWVYGSTAEHVVRQCAVPLLLVRTSGHAEGSAPSAVENAVANVL